MNSGSKHKKGLRFIKRKAKKIFSMKNIMIGIIIFVFVSNISASILAISLVI